MHPSPVSDQRMSVALVGDLTAFLKKYGERLVTCGLLAALIGLAMAVPAEGAPLQRPSLVALPTQERHVGKVIVVERVTPSLASHQRDIPR